jgi:uncharacterized protein (DUF1778 family)
MARPKKNPDSLLDAELRIRVTAEQHRLIMKAVELEQSDMSAWARLILIKAAKDRVDRLRGQK